MNSLTRRAFACRAALLSAAPGLASTATASPAVDGNEVETRLSVIVSRYGSRLSPQQIDHLRKILSDNERMLARVRSFALTNGDTPASVLKIRPERQELSEP